MFCSKIGGECPHPVITDENYVFCIMPFKNYTSVYDAIKTAIEGIKGKKFECDRADKQYTNRSIWCKRICSRIRKAKYCIADTTGMNPNVFYELGFAHTSHNTNTIIITQNIKEAPFDIKDLGHVIYSEKDLPKLRLGLQEAILDIEKEELEIDYKPLNTDEMIFQLKKDLRVEENRSDKYKNDARESEKREIKLKEKIKELEAIQKEPVEEAKRRISELQGTIAGLKSDLSFAKEDTETKDGSIISLQTKLKTNEDKLRRITKELNEYKNSKDNKGLSELMMTDEHIIIQSHKWYNKGVNATNNYDEIQYYTKALEINPEFFEAYNNRGEAYRGLKEYAKSMKDFNKALEINPNLALTYSNKGIVYCNIKEYKKALKEFTKALEIDPNIVTVYLNIIELLIITTQYKKVLVKIKNLNVNLKLSEKLALNYLECITNKMLNLPTDELEDKINTLLKEDVEVKWSFREIDEWLEEASFKKDTKKYITELTEKLKERAKEQQRPLVKMY